MFLLHTTFFFSVSWYNVTCRSESETATLLTATTQAVTYLFDQDDGVQLATVYDCSVFTINGNYSSAPNSPVEITTLEMAGESYSWGIVGRGILLDRKGVQLTTVCDCHVCTIWETIAVHL